MLQVKCLHETISVVECIEKKMVVWKSERLTSGSCGGGAGNVGAVDCTTGKWYGYFASVRKSAKWKSWRGSFSFGPLPDSGSSTICVVRCIKSSTSAAEPRIKVLLHSKITKYAVLEWLFVTVKYFVICYCVEKSLMKLLNINNLFFLR